MTNRKARIIFNAISIVMTVWSALCLTLVLVMELSFSDFIAVSSCFVLTSGVAIAVQILKRKLFKGDEE